MKHLLTFFLLMVFSFSFAQEEVLKNMNGKKGQFYFYWGWNEDAFSKSDIHFKGANYDFTLYDVIAKDRQNKFGLNPHFNLGSITIPQYNFRLGYYFHDKYNISIGVDHMKYVVKQLQTVNITGNINTGSLFDGVYNNDAITIQENFLKFEHTDGLNYLNTEIRRVDDIARFKKIAISLTEGAGFGVLFPRTNTTLLNKQRYDEFHVAGYGLGAMVGVNVTFFKHFFLQSELKGGFINMPNIRTTMSKTDTASQHFFFVQANIVFGATFNLL